MRVIIKKDYEECSVWAANHIADAIKKFNPDEEKPFVIGLPTGSTPLGIYAKLAEKCRAKELSFKNVISFNMDEYVGLAPDNENSYRYFMNRNFFDLIDINKANTHLLDGCAADLEAECENFEKMIAESGGIKLFLGGIGNDGHLAFNEPGSSLTGRTHVQLLTEDTRSVNSRFFWRRYFKSAGKGFDGWNRYYLRCGRSADYCIGQGKSLCCCSCCGRLCKPGMACVGLAAA